MPTTYKVLGQVSPASTAAVNLYTAPSSTSTIVSSITVCNYLNTAATYRIAVRPGGANLENKHYVAYEVSIPGYATDTLTLGITLAATDVIDVTSTGGSVSFHAYGSEIV